MPLVIRFLILAGLLMESFQGKKVRITGTIQLYRGKPEIKVLSRGQIAEE